MWGTINIPLSEWAKFPTANYVDPHTQPKYLLIFSCIVGTISIALLCTRLYVRICVQRNAQLDDWVMTVAYIPVITLTIMYPIGECIQVQVIMSTNT